MDIAAFYNGEHPDITALTGGAGNGDVYLLIINEKGELLLRRRSAPFDTPEKALTWFDDLTAAMTGINKAEEAYKADSNDMETARKLAGMYDILGRFKDSLPLLEKIIPKLSGPESFDTRIMYVRATWEVEHADLLRGPHPDMKPEDLYKKTQELFLPLFDELIKAKDGRAADLWVNREQRLDNVIPWKDPVDIVEKLRSTFPIDTLFSDGDVLITLGMGAIFNPNKGVAARAQKYLEDALAQELAKDKPDEYTVDGLQDLLSDWKSLLQMSKQMRGMSGIKPPAPPSEEPNEQPEESNEQPDGAREEDF